MIELLFLSIVGCILGSMVCNLFKTRQDIERSFENVQSSIDDMEQMIYRSTHSNRGIK